MIDWEAWAAIFTFVAVAVSLWQSRSSTRLVLRLRDEDRREADAKNKARATRLALALDHELFAYGGSLSDLADEISDEKLEADALQGVHYVHQNFPIDPLPLLSRFADELEIFEPDLAAKLMLILGGWNSLKENPRVEDLEGAPLELVKVGMSSTRLLFDQTMAHIRAARDGLKPLAAPYRKGWIDFGTAARTIREERELHAISSQKLETPK